MASLSFLPSWADVQNIVGVFGWTKGIFTIFFFLAHFWVYRAYEGRLQDRQLEIDRLAADNRDLRDRFTALLDKHMGYKSEGRHKKE